jgi:hypothetical protein
MKSSTIICLAMYVELTEIRPEPAEGGAILHVASAAMPNLESKLGAWDDS